MSASETAWRKLSVGSFSPIGAPSVVATFSCSDGEPHLEKRHRRVAGRAPHSVYTARSTCKPVRDQRLAVGCPNCSAFGTRRTCPGPGEARGSTPRLSIDSGHRGRGDALTAACSPGMSGHKARGGAIYARRYLGGGRFLCLVNNFSDTPDGQAVCEEREDNRGDHDVRSWWNGAEWIWNLASQRFPGAIQIVQLVPCPAAPVGTGTQAAPQ